MSPMNNDNRIDALIDRALEELTSATAAPDFVPRVRAHIERRRRSSGWRHAPAVAGVIAVAGLLAFVGLTTTEPIPLKNKPSEPTAAAPPAPIVGTSPAHVPARRRVTTKLAAPTPQLAVIVPDQRAAIVRLMSSLSVGGSEPSNIFRNVPADRAPITIEPIRIEPVVVQPLGDR